MTDFKLKLEGLGITSTKKQDEQLAKYYEMLVTWNEKMNLTAITAHDDVYLKHFYDSLTPAAYFDYTSIKTLCDVGAGAGFPSIVLKIFFPHLQLTIVEALEKRLTFLRALIAEIGLEDVTLVHERAEIFAQTHRETFDAVTARAVAKLPMLAELCVPLVKLKGMFIALKGERGLEEQAEAKNALQKLGIGKVIAETLYLTEASDKRIILLCEKERLTPVKYPRNFGQIKAKPL